MPGPTSVGRGRRLLPALSLLAPVLLAPALLAPELVTGRAAATVRGPENDASTHASGADDVRTLDPSALPRGADATVHHLRNRVIHTADGRRIRVPRADRTALLGRSGTRWLVAVRKGFRDAVLAVRPGTEPQRIWGPVKTYGDEALGFRLSRDGRQLVVTGFDRGGSSASVYDARTRRVVGRRASAAYVLPIDATAGRVLTYGFDQQGDPRTVEWTPGLGMSGRRVIAGDSSAAFMDRDLLFLRAGDGYGPTALSAPGAPPWSEGFAPLDVSPDGLHAVGYRLPTREWHDPAILQVRSMVDGSVLAQFRAGPTITMHNWQIGRTHEQTVRWESDSTFVFQLTRHRQGVLVRCDLAGACERASGWGRNLSVPYESFVWW